MCPYPVNISYYLNESKFINLFNITVFNNLQKHFLQKSIFLFEILKLLIVILGML